MAQIRIYHPFEVINSELTKSGFSNGQTISEDKVMDAVKKIFYSGVLNVMIQHTGAKNTIIWVDKGTFKQR